MVTIDSFRRCMPALVMCCATLGAGPVDAAQVSRAPYGVTAAGEQVEVFTLSNDHGMSARVLSYGGIINAITAPDREGACTNVVLNLRNLQAYEARANFSSLLGRYANRISGGGFTLDGVRHDLPSNSRGISSHGGPGGFGARVWKSEPFQHATEVGVVLRYSSADGENGYPGNLSVQITYTLTEANTLRLAYQAVSDRPTVLNLSHHAYFNLAGGGTIYGHKVQIFADRYTPIDARKLPIGRIEAVEGTPLDLRAPTLIGDRVNSQHVQIRLARGFDHNFVLNKTHAGALTRAARVEDPASGRILEVYTTEPGLQLYTANSFDGSLVDAKGRPLVRGAGMALETQHFPDSPNRPEFPSTVLRRGEVFRSTTEYRFSAG